MKNVLIASVSSAALMFGVAYAGPEKDKAKAADETVEFAEEGEGDVDYDAWEPEADDTTTEGEGEGEGEEEGEADPE